MAVTDTFADRDPAERSALNRLFYRDRRPTWLGHWASQFFCWWARAGLPPRSWFALEVRDRVSGRMRADAVVIPTVGGERYIVSMFGTISDWVHNIEAAHGDAAISHGGTLRVHLVPVPPEERAPILREYVRLASSGRKHFPLAVGAPLADFAAIAAQYPVYRVEPAGRLNLAGTIMSPIEAATDSAAGMRMNGTRQIVRSRDGTRIGYLSVGSGPSVLVIPGVLSMAADYAAFARALAEHFTVHTLERRGRGESGPQGNDYSIAKECEDVLAVQAETGAAFLVGHSYGGLVALEVARNNKAFRKIAVYEPGVSIDGSMPTAWMPGYKKKLAEKRNVDALVEFTLADAPPRIQKTPRWLMKLLLLVLVSWSRQYRQMLDLLDQNLREWREIARLDSSCEHYREIAGGVLLMYGGKSDSKAVTLAMERLAAILPHSETKGFPRLDHFGIERTAPREVAKAVSDYFLT